jgi:hypothetical protein
VKIALQSTTEIHWQYATSDDVKTLSGMSARVHFNDKVIEWIDAGDIFTTGFVSKAKFADDNNFDHDTTTNSYIEYIWQDTNNAWPWEFPTSLLTTQFKLIAEIDDFANSSIRITGAHSPQRIVDGKNILYIVKADEIKVGKNNAKDNLSLDINGDGKVSLPIDGFIILRYMVGFPASALASDEDMIDATRTRDEMKSYMDSFQ